MKSKLILLTVLMSMCIVAAVSFYYSQYAYTFVCVFVAVFLLMPKNIK
jgi:hypothetical protein